MGDPSSHYELPMRCTRLNSQVIRSSVISYRASASMLCGLLVCCMLACGGQQLAVQPTSMRPWEGRFKSLFDNGIEPAAVGLSLDGSTPEEHPLLASRVPDAEIVAILSIQTLSSDSFGVQTRYTLTMQVDGQPLIPAHTSQRRFELQVLRGMPGFGIVERLGTELRGRKFIGFLRRFPGNEGPQWRWHLTAATRAVAEVIRTAATVESAAQIESEEH